MSRTWNAPTSWSRATTGRTGESGRTRRLSCQSPTPRGGRALAFLEGGAHLSRSARDHDSSTASWSYLQLESAVRVPDRLGPRWGSVSSLEACGEMLLNCVTGRSLSCRPALGAREPRLHIHPPPVAALQAVQNQGTGQNEALAPSCVPGALQCSSCHIACYRRPT